MTDQVTRSIIVKADISTVYRIWADFETFPHFMKNIRSVTKTGPSTSHWVMAGPLGRKVEWDADTTRLEPNKRIGWSSKDHSSLTTSGQVTFLELGHGETQVTVTLHYDPPAGLAGEVVAELFSHPEAKLHEDLKNFKKFAEAQAAGQMPGKLSEDLPGYGGSVGSQQP